METQSSIKEAYESLANAIVLQAVSEYRAALKRVKEHPHNNSAISNAKSIEKFFRSGWYEALTAVDGEYLIEKLRDEAGITDTDMEVGRR